MRHPRAVAQGEPVCSATLSRAAILAVLPILGGCSWALSLPAPVHAAVLSETTAPGNTLGVILPIVIAPIVIPPVVIPPVVIAPVVIPPVVIPPVVIPPIEGPTLAGDRVRLPADLAPTTRSSRDGRTAILIVGFGREARDAARDWGLHLAADTASLPGTVYFEMPVLAGVPRLLRGSVLHMMASSVSERGRQHFLPITDNEPAWRDAVGFRDAAVPYILVVDDHGAVRWRTSGAFTATIYAELRAHLAAASR